MYRRVFYIEDVDPVFYLYFKDADMSKDKTWSGRFNEPVSELVKKYTGSIDFDKRLAEWDIQGSLAHAQMLTQSGVLSEDDLFAIRQGMAEIIAEIKEGTISWSLDLEDVHMNIERRLTDKIGDAGKRLHTGRSRNDQEIGRAHV